MVYLIYCGLCYFEFPLNLSRARGKREFPGQSITSADPTCNYPPVLLPEKLPLSLPSQTTTEGSTPPVEGTDLLHVVISDNQVRQMVQLPFPLQVQLLSPFERNGWVGGRRTQLPCGDSARLASRPLHALSVSTSFSCLPSTP